MWKAIIVFTVFTLQLVLSAFRGNSHFEIEKVCKNKDNVRAVWYPSDRELGDRNLYTLVVEYDFKQFYLVVLKFDTEDANVTVIDDTPAMLISNPKDRRFHAIFTADASSLRLSVKGTSFGSVPYPTNIQVNSVEICEDNLTIDDTPAMLISNPKDRRFHAIFTADASSLRLSVKGTSFGSVPYPTNIQVNSVEICEDNLTGYIDEYVTGNKTIPDESCGRRKFDHTELIVRGLQSKPGDWPWHAALFDVRGKKSNFICGGTLLSDTFILTAAHCVTTMGLTPVLPETRKVILGKYNIFGEDVAAQERDVEQIIVHEEFDSALNNDIALIKMKTPVVFTDYVQPACIWYTETDKKLQQENINGTVVGWGFDQTDTLSSTLQQITIPKQTETACIKSNPLFFSRMLNNQKFCAGFGNGTSACNGDSGGGFMVFVPDKLGNNTTGAWYVRGIVSLTVRRSDAPVCNPHQFVIFTDVAEYRGWMFSDKTNFRMPT